jgi:hypothetical protein
MLTITLLGEVHEWPSVEVFRDSFTLVEEEQVEEWADTLYEQAYRQFWGGGRKAAHAFLFVLYRRRHPEAKWSDLDGLLGHDWDIKVIEDPVTKPAKEPAVPTKAPVGGDGSASSGRTTTSA